MLDWLAHHVVRHRFIVIGAWIALTVFGGYSAGQVSDRWLEEFSIPGAEGYEANQRARNELGNGELYPFVLVLRSQDGGDVTDAPGVEAAIEKAAAANPDSRVSSFFNTGDDIYVSHDRTVTFANVYAAGRFSFEGIDIEPTREALAAALPTGVDGYVTGIDALYEEASTGEGGSEPPSVLVESIIGGLGALVILLFTFGTVPAIAMPLLIAIASILNTFTLIWILTYITDVSIIVQFLVALVGLGVAIDYALVMIFRFRDELRHGADREEAVVMTMRHAGRAVIVSGSTVAVGLLSMLLLPLPFLRSMGIGGMLIPAVSVLTAITLLPALLYTLGHRINNLRVLPRRFVVGSDDPEHGFWNRWARFVTKRPLPAAAAGLVIVGALLYYGVQLNPADAQAEDLPGGGPGHDAVEVLTDAGITPGVHKPFQIVVEGAVTPEKLEQLAGRLDESDGIAGASAPTPARSDGFALVEAFSASDGSSSETAATVDRLKDDVLPAAEGELDGVQLTLAGLPTEEQEFIDAVYDNFPYLLLFVVLLTYVLLMRAFRSVLLALKAVILNLISLGAAYGIIVFIFQKGHGAEEIWNVPATDSIISWIPVMIFAFLFGLSMDYEVFMLSRMREAYDETGNTEDAIRLGLARTGKLVTSAALVLMFAFIVLSTSPGTDIKQFGIGAAAGIIFDATVIRALLVPSIMMLMGRWNWWLPPWAARVLRVRPGTA
jgi:RND superfamily putative drug exporter